MTTTFDPLFIHPTAPGTADLRRPKEQRVVPTWALVLVLLAMLLTVGSFLFSGWVSHVTDRDARQAAGCTTTDAPLASYRTRTEAVAAGEVTQVAGVTLCR